MKSTFSPKTLLLSMLALLLTSSAALAGGGWPQKKGNAYIKLSQWWTVSNRHYTDLGLIDPNVTTGLFNTNIYAEYGFTNRLTGILYAPFFSRTYMNNIISGTTGETLVPGEALNGFGDSDIGIKYGLTKPGSKIAVAGTILLGLPIGNDAGGSQQNLQTGDGEFNQLIQLDVGKSFQLGKNVNGYANALIGFNNRTNDFSDEFRYGLEVGAGLLDNRLWIAEKLNGTESFMNGATADQVTSTSVFANNAEIMALTTEVAVYATSRIGFAGSVTVPVRGKITFARPSYSLGVFLDLKRN